MARIEPNPTDLTDAFWDATRAQQYLVQWCVECATPIFYPREVCPMCMSSSSLEWRASSGRGTVHAISVQHRPGNPTMADRVPYAVALIDVDAGDGVNTIRVMSNVVNCDPESVDIGDAVALTWEPLSDGRHLPVFEPWGTSDA